MKLEQQVCSLEQAKRLKELGVKQYVSFFQWCIVFPRRNAPRLAPFISWVASNSPSYREYDINKTETYDALTTGELGAALPHRFISYKSNDRFDLAEGLYYVSSLLVAECPRIYGSSEAQARAAMLIHLLENNLITADEVNERL